MLKVTVQQVQLCVRQSIQKFHVRLEGLILGHLGLCHHLIGNNNEAIKQTEQALAIAEEFGDKISEGTFLYNLSYMDDRNDVGRLETAQEIFNNAGHPFADRIREELPDIRTKARRDLVVGAIIFVVLFLILIYFINL